MILRSRELIKYNSEKYIQYIYILQLDYNAIGCTVYVKVYFNFLKS